MFFLSTTLLNLSVPGAAHFPVLSSTLIRSRSQVKPATHLIPIDPVLFLCGGGVYRYQSGSFSLIHVGSGFLLPVKLLCFPSLFFYQIIRLQICKNQSLAHVHIRKLQGTGEIPSIPPELRFPCVCLCVCVCVCVCRMPLKRGYTIYYIPRVGQNRISAPYMTVCMVISLLKIP
jgi:hypothetical protein